MAKKKYFMPVRDAATHLRRLLRGGEGLPKANGKQVRGNGALVVLGDSLQFLFAEHYDPTDGQIVGLRLCMISYGTAAHRSSPFTLLPLRPSAEQLLDAVRELSAKLCWNCIEHGLGKDDAALCGSLSAASLHKLIPPPELRTVVTGGLDG